jgi:hypothetical protein
MNDLDRLEKALALNRDEMAALTDALQRVSNQLLANSQATWALIALVERRAARKPWWRW